MSVPSARRKLINIQRLDTLGKGRAVIVKDRYASDSVSFNAITNVVDGETMGVFGVIKNDDRTRAYELVPAEVERLLATPEALVTLPLDAVIDRHARLLLKRIGNPHGTSQGEDGYDGTVSGR
jgi:hypothetical protein